MTLYYSGEDDQHNESEWSPAESGKRQIIENHPEYVEFTDDGEMVINVDEMDRSEKQLALARAAIEAVEDSDDYNVVQDAEFEWRG